jgi:hypothetical protein
MEGVERLSVHDKISMIKNRYKSTKDLWLYMTERRKLFSFYLNLAMCLFSRFFVTISEELSVEAHSRHSLKA